MEYRNIKTGEIAPAHRIGSTKDGQPLYQAIDGWEPTTNYKCDREGNWIEIKNPAAVALGKIGGSVKSPAKSKASAANGAKGGRPRKVVTWQASNGDTIDICRYCEKDLAGNWPRNSQGEEFSCVSHGLHPGSCAICNPTTAPA